MAKVLIDRMYVHANGMLLGMSDSSSLEYQGDNIPIETTVLDYAGVYAVPKRAVLSVESFVPTTGFELDVVKLWLATTEVQFDLQFGGSGKRMKASGFIDAPSITSTPTAPTKVSFKATVDAKPFD